MYSSQAHGIQALQPVEGQNEPVRHSCEAFDADEAVGVIGPAGGDGIPGITSSPVADVFVMLESESFGEATGPAAVRLQVDAPWED